MMRKVMIFLAAVGMSVASLNIESRAADFAGPKQPNAVTPPTGKALPPTTGGVGARAGLPGGVRIPPGVVSALTGNGCVSMGGEINRDSKECNDQGYLTCKIMDAGIAHWVCIDNK